MTIIIDGNNLIHKIPHLKKLFLKDKESAQYALIEIINSYKHKSDSVTFVFDGAGKLARKEVVYSKDVTADEVIRKKIENFSNAKLMKVVSSDHEIMSLAKVCGCAVIKSEDFWKELNKPQSPEGKNINQNYIYDEKEKPERSSKKDIDEFKRYFS
ncbi:MAG: NYN domain-containing protein [Ignavibacteria bacterium]